MASHMVDDDGQTTGGAPLKMAIGKRPGYTLQTLRAFLQVCEDQGLADSTPVEARVAFGGRLRELRVERK